jgi:hypothetical protein
VRPPLLVEDWVAISEVEAVEAAEVDCSSAASRLISVVVRLVMEILNVDGVECCSDWHQSVCEKWLEALVAVTAGVVFDLVIQDHLFCSLLVPSSGCMVERVAKIARLRPFRRHGTVSEHRCHVTSNEGAEIKNDGCTGAEVRSGVKGPTRSRVH